MLPPIPQGLVPVTSQQDEVKPKPAIAPVTPVQETAQGSALGVERDDISAAQERARDEQRRRQRQQQAERAMLDGEPVEEDENDTGELSRKGLWVDLKV